MENQKEEAHWINEWEEEHAAPYMYRYIETLVLWIRIRKDPKLFAVSGSKYLWSEPKVDP
jgi:hypothetical protein